MKWKRPVRTVSLLFLLSGVALFVAMSYSLVQATRSTSWPVATATIIEWEVRTRSGDTPARHKLHYKYRVEGNVYTGSRIAFGSVTNRWMLKALIRKYQPQTHHNVSYDPGSPGTSVLEPGGHLGIAFGYVSSVLFIAGGVYGKKRAAVA